LCAASIADHATAVAAASRAGAALQPNVIGQRRTVNIFDETDN